MLNFFEAADLEMTDELQKALLNLMNKKLRERLEYALTKPFYCLQKNAPIGTFCVYIYTGEETDVDDIRSILTLDGLVDRTIVLHEDPEFLKELADEFDRLAALLRDASE